MSKDLDEKVPLSSPTVAAPAATTRASTATTGTIATIPVVATTPQSSQPSQPQGCWQKFLACFLPCCAKTEQVLEPVLQVAENVGVSALQAFVTGKIQGSGLTQEQKNAAITAANASISSLGNSALSGFNNLADAANHYTTRALSAQTVAEATAAALANAAAPLAQAAAQITADSVKNTADAEIDKMTWLGSTQKATLKTQVNNAIDGLSNSALKAYGSVQNAVNAMITPVLKSGTFVGATLIDAQSQAQPTALASSSLTSGTSSAIHPLLAMKAVTSSSAINPPTSGNLVFDSVLHNVLHNSVPTTSYTTSTILSVPVGPAAAHSTATATSSGLSLTAPLHLDDVNLTGAAHD